MYVIQFIGVFIVPANSVWNILAVALQIKVAEPVCSRCKLCVLWLVGLAISSPDSIHFVL